MNMESVFILTYVGIAIAAAGVAGMICAANKTLSIRGLIFVARILAQVTMMWFCSFGMAVCLLVLYRVFWQLAELTILAVTIAYVAGVGCTILMWTFVMWRCNIGETMGK